MIYLFGGYTLLPEGDFPVFLSRHFSGPSLFFTPQGATFFWGGPPSIFAPRFFLLLLSSIEFLGGFPPNSWFPRGGFLLTTFFPRCCVDPSLAAFVFPFSGEAFFIGGARREGALYRGVYFPTFSERCPPLSTGGAHIFFSRPPRLWCVLDSLFLAAPLERFFWPRVFCWGVLTTFFKRPKKRENLLTGGGTYFTWGDFGDKGKIFFVGKRFFTTFLGGNRLVGPRKKFFWGHNGGLLTRSRVFFRIVGRFLYTNKPLFYRTGFWTRSFSARYLWYHLWGVLRRPPGELFLRGVSRGFLGLF